MDAGRKQARAARGLIDWSLDPCIVARGVSRRTLIRFERAEGENLGLPQSPLSASPWRPLASSSSTTRGRARRAAWRKRSMSVSGAPTLWTRG